MSASSIFMRAALEISGILSAAMPDSTPVYVRRARGLPQIVLSCVVVRVHRALATTGISRGVPSIWGTHIQVECMVRTCSGVDAVADQLMNLVIGTLTPERLTGTPVAGLELSQIEWDDDYDGESTVCISISYQLRHGGPFGGGVRI